MGYVSYNKTLENKINGLGIIRLKRDIPLENGVIEAGSRLQRVCVFECNEDGDRCKMKIYGYRDAFACTVTFKNFDVDKWFEADSELTSLDKRFRDASSNLDEVDYWSEYVLMLMLSALAVMAIMLLSSTVVGAVIAVIAFISCIIAFIICRLLLSRYKRECNEMDNKIKKILKGTRYATKRLESAMSYE